MTKRIGSWNAPLPGVIVALGAVLIGVVLSVAGAVFLVDYSRDQARAQAERELVAVTQRIQRKVDGAMAALNAIRALHDASALEDPDGFRRFVVTNSSLTDGVIALGWIAHVTDAERKAFEAKLVSSSPKPRIIERTGHGFLVPARKRPSYYPVRYLVSATGVDIDIGLNLAAHHRRGALMNRAIESGDPVVTPLITLGNGSRYAIEVYAPVFRPSPTLARQVSPSDSLSGFAFGIFKVDELVKAALSESDADAHLVVEDPAGRFIPIGYGNEVPDPTSWDATRTIEIADQSWKVHFSLGTLQSPTPWRASLFLLAGLAITGTLVTYVLAALIRGRKLASVSRHLAAVERRLIEEQTQARFEATRRAEAEATSHQKTRFLQAMSHDLRQPLHALGLYLDQCREALSRGRDSRSLLARMERSLESLNDNFDAVLNHSRLESGLVETDVKAVALGPLARRLLDEYDLLAQEQGRELLGQIDEVTVQTDPALIERVIRNLIVNAFRHTEHGVIGLRVRRRPQRADIRVHDAGPGFPAALKETAFTPYVRGEARDTGKGERSGFGPNLGLGLAIVQEICAALKHPLTLRTQEGAGASFRIDLPLADAVGAAAKVDPVMTGGGVPEGAVAGRRVLLLEDDPAVAEATRGTLTGWGMSVTHVASIADARARLAGDSAFDVLLLDYRLPDGFGTALLDDPDVARRAVIVSGEAVPPPWGDRVPVLKKPVLPLKLRATLMATLTAAADAAHP